MSGFGMLEEEKVVYEYICASVSPRSFQHRLVAVEPPHSCLLEALQPLLSAAGPKALTLICSGSI